jgi:small subunit ribosomal protein S13
MPRILGVDVPDGKKVKIALTYIYGVGPTRAQEICTRCQIDPEARIKSLTEADINHLNTFIQDTYTVEGDLRRQVAQDIRRLQAIGSYRGFRHKRGLPVRGQRTKTNARTRKGGKRTVGAIRDKTERKLAKKG